MTGESIVEVAAIAAKLTKAQRALIVRGPAGDESMATIRACVAKGLMYLRIDSPDGRHGFIENTSAGEAIRTHLISQGADHDR